MNKLHKFIRLSVILFLLFFSCKKDSRQTKTELLTSKTWMYDELYFSYNFAPTLHYKRGNTNNLANLDAARFNYRSDGTWTQITDLGGILGGTWHFINNETEIEITTVLIGTATSKMKVITLDDQNFVWYDSALSNNGGTYAKMIPQ